MSQPRQSSFLFGEVSPASQARADLAFYRSAVKKARNGTVLRTGGFQSRAGTQYLASTKSDGVAVLVEAVFDDDEGYVLEFGNLYVRVWLAGALVGPQTTAAWSVSSISYAQGQTVTNGAGPNVYVCILAHTSAAGSEPGVGASWETYWYDLGASATAVYEYPTPYTTAQLDAVKAQAKVTALNTLTIVHPSHEPATLTRIANPNAAAEWVWVLNDIDFENSSTTRPFDAPTGVAVSGTAGSGVGYVVTRTLVGYGIGLDALTVDQETVVSSVVRTNIAFGSDTTVAATLASANRTISWTGVADACVHRVYRQHEDGGAYHLVGSFTAGAAYGGAFQVVDTGTFSTFSGVSPAEESVSYSGNASVVGAYQQRLMLAGKDAEPDYVYASRTAEPYDFGVQDPIVDSDAMSWRQLLAGGRLNRIRHFAEVAQRLVQFASASEAVIQGDGLILRPSEVNPRVISQNGASIYPAPLVINDTALYVQARQGIVRDLVPLEQGFVGSDLTLLSAHLVDGYTIEDWCYQQTPNSVVWVVRSDGSLLSLTYVRESGIVGWATHDTDGDYLSVACVPESGKDVVYAVVERTINSVTKRYVERFYDRLASVPVQLDCGKSVTMTTGAVTGLSHLEGETVSVLKSDGTVLASPYNSAYTAVVVASGGFTIAGAGNATVYVGLPFVSDIQTLDLDSSGQTLKDTALNIVKVGLWLNASNAPFAGQAYPASATAISDSTATLYQMANTTTIDGPTTTAAISGYRETNIDGQFTRSGSIALRQVDPVPLEILAIVPYVSK